MQAVTRTRRAMDPGLRPGEERGCLVAALSGRLDSERAPAVREQLLRLLRPAAIRLVLDLTLVSDIDAAGLAVLVGTERRARLLGGALRLAAAGLAVSMAVRSAGLDRLLASIPTVQAAGSPARRGRHRGEHTRATVAHDRPGMRRQRARQIARSPCSTVGGHRSAVREPALIDPVAQDSHLRSAGRHVHACRLWLLFGPHDAPSRTTPGARIRAYRE
jgi:anti-sigma B factor antagonist